jgi:thiamine-phosphate pyrophosphorylase
VTPRDPGDRSRETLSCGQPRREQRRARLAAARLYLVCDARPGGRPLAHVLPAALAGGVDVVQLRDKRLSGEELVAAARVARELCEQAGALLIVNDDPAVALAAGADGVHVGQDDMPVARVREIVGPELVVGLSTHTPAEVTRAGGLSGAPAVVFPPPAPAAASPNSDGPPAVDYIGVGPVYATPTKPGRPATGLELVWYAAAHAPRPWFAIGGIDATNAAAVLAAGARRVAVVRAIADAADPEGAARALRALLDEHPLDDSLEHARAGAAHA